MKCANDESDFGLILTGTPIESGNRLYNWIESVGKILAGSKTLFLIDDINDDETLNK